ncbi:hypothetical protein JCM10212_000205 [Sporobolomyces blumeae]
MGYQLYTSPDKRALALLNEIKAYCALRGENVVHFVDAVVATLTHNEDDDLARRIEENLKRALKWAHHGEFLTTPTGEIRPPFLLVYDVSRTQPIDDAPGPEPYERNPWVPKAIAEYRLATWPRSLQDRRTQRPPIPPDRAAFVALATVTRDRYRMYHKSHDDWHRSEESFNLCLSQFDLSTDPWDADKRIFGAIRAAEMLRNRCLLPAFAPGAPTRDDHDSRSADDATTSSESSESDSGPSPRGAPQAQTRRRRRESGSPHESVPPSQRPRLNSLGAGRISLRTAKRIGFNGRTADEGGFEF